LSRYKHRKEKNCLNCGTKVTDLYCPHCGQENIEAKETFWHLVSHFFNDITHFDGKFFSTSKNLLIKPGFLSSEYSAGKRVSYLNPIRMYLFTSAIFFLLFFSVYKPDVHSTPDQPRTYASTKKAIEKKIASLEDGKKEANNETIRKIIQAHISDLTSDLERLKTDTTHLAELNYYTKDLSLSSDNYKSVAEYDSAQALLAKSERDGWILRQFKIKEIHIRDKYGNDSKAMVNALINKFLHSFPQMFFVSLPFFALLLKLLYRRKKEYFFVDHFIYSLHLYCAMFLFILAQMGLSALEDLAYMGWLKFIKIGLSVYMLYYLYRSMRSFYKAGRWSTIFKYIMLLLLTIVMMSILFVIFFIVSAFTV
jgi:hypothetical protein